MPIGKVRNQMIQWEVVCICAVDIVANGKIKIAHHSSAKQCVNYSPDLVCINSVQDIRTDSLIKYIFRTLHIF